MIAAILALASAVPIINQWLEQLSTAFIAAKISGMKKENADAIRKAIADQDQRPIEQAIQSTHAGAPSGIEGTVIVDEIPGIRKVK